MKRFLGKKTFHSSVFYFI